MVNLLLVFRNALLENKKRKGGDATEEHVLHGK